MQLNKIIIGTIMVSVIMAGMVYLYAEGVTQYTPAGYNSSKLESISSEIDELDVIIRNTEENVTGLRGSVSEADAASVLITGGYRAAKIAVKSGDVITNMSQTAMSSMPMGDYSYVVLGALGLIVIVIFIVGILIHMATKSNRA